MAKRKRCAGGIGGRFWKGQREMQIDQSLLKFEEKAVFMLRGLYSQYGYRQFKMSKFEEYDLYAKNKDFLVSEGIITFTDVDGRLRALKPDVTLSIIKNSREQRGVTEKYYYNENVYRISDTSHTYKEIMQAGIECIGDISEEQVFEVVLLAMKSLALIRQDFVLDICHIGLIHTLLEENSVDPLVNTKLFAAIHEKNTGALKQLLTPAQFESLKCLTETHKSFRHSLAAVKASVKSGNALKYLAELEDVCLNLEKEGYGDNIRIDFSIASLGGYYSGIVFKGFLSGVASQVISGGRYDKLMKRMGKSSSALGFAVYLDALERINQVASGDGFINIALPKGRLGERVYGLFEAAGFECPSIKETNRKLVFENKEKKLRYFWVKPSDVAIYVERGAADIGVAGKDILLEYAPDVYELLDLNVGKCRMAVAAKKDFHDDTSKTLRVATKFSNIAKGYYNEKCRDIDIIHLNGSIEIAPILGLSDVIVDIVETGKTLLENDLVPFETIVPISARLIANKASFGFKQEIIERIQKGLLSEVRNND